MPGPTVSPGKTVTAKNNVQYWEEYGDYVFMAMPYADEVIVGAGGSTLHDANGGELLDLASGMFCSVLGHNHPQYVERLTKQVNAVVHTGTQFLTPAVMEAGYKLAQVAPGNLKRSIFLSTGTEANEFAFRVAKAYTGRTGIMGMARGYYGTSVATKSCSGLFSHQLRDSLPVVPENTRLPFPPQCLDCFTGSGSSDCGAECLESQSSAIADWSNIAAVIVEPILSAGGMLFPPPGYLKALQQLAHKNGALFIVDEAQTGFGRTGKWFAIEHHDVVPDILTLSKSIGNGYPVAAVVTTAEIADNVTSKGLWNLSSHQSDPLAGAAVSAVIDIVRSEGLVDRARESGEYFLQCLRSLAGRQPAFTKIRGVGLMIGFDWSPADRDEKTGAMSFMLNCRRRGLHLTYGYDDRNFRIIPPLVLSRDQIDFAVRAMEDAARETLQNPAPASRLAPANPYTRRLFARQGKWRRILNYCWRSSPQQVVEKAREVLSAGRHRE